MFKNTPGQKITVLAVDSTTHLPKTGDAANITCYVSKDDGSLTALADTSATEISSTHAKGYYLFDLAQAETNGDKLLYSAVSTTANIVVTAVPAVIFTTLAPVGFNTLPSLTEISFGSTSNILRFALFDTTGAPFADAFDSDNLQITVLASNASTAIQYILAEAGIETIATLGTYVAPTTNKCRFRNVADNLWELQLEDSLFGISGARELLIEIIGGNSADVDQRERVLLPLTPGTAKLPSFTEVPFASSHNVLRFDLYDTAGNPFDGTFDSDNLDIDVLANNAASGFNYSSEDGFIQTIATAGTYATPATNSCRFKNISGHTWELQLADAVFASSGSRELIINIQGGGTADVDQDERVLLTQTSSSSGNDGDISMVPISPEFIAVLPKRSSGSVSTASPLRIKTSEDTKCAIDFTNILAAGEYLTQLTTIVTTNMESITLTVLGVDHALAKFEVSNVEADTSYIVVATIHTSLGNTLEGQCTIAASS